MKYTFEIMKEYEDAFRGISVYSVSEDKKLMVDFVALEELEDAQKKIDEAYHKGWEYGKEYGLDEADMREAVSYQKGLDDAWEAARKIGHASQMQLKQMGFEFNSDDRFYNPSWYAVMNCTAVEAIAKLKAYEERQETADEIKVGDVVRLCRHTVPYIVTSCDGDDDTYILMTVNGGFIKAEKCNVRKTGRHFDISKILEEMKE